MRVAIDTNVLAYAEGIDDDARRRDALAVVAAIPPGLMVIPVQAVSELFQLLVRKGHSRVEAAARVDIWIDAATLQETSVSIMLSAIALSVSAQLTVWDAIIVASAAAAGCALLLSEDMQHGRTYGAVTVVNPFAHPPHPLLAAALASR